jgi:vacuolar-type H+-ATPase subunit I/STV1
MFGDVFAGGVVLLLGLLGFRWDPKQGGLKGFIAQARGLLTAMGLSAVFFGFMFGAVAGLEGHNSPIPALWFSPEETYIHQFGGASGQFALLQLSLVVGILHIGLGLILLAINEIRHGEWTKAIFFPIMLLIAYGAAAFLVFSYGLNFENWIKADLAGAFDIAIFPFLGYGTEKGDHSEFMPALIQVGSPVPFTLLMIAAFLIFALYMWFSEGIDGVSEALDFILTLLSNSISYARLFAVFIVHGILARIFVDLIGLEYPVEHFHAILEEAHVEAIFNRPLVFLDDIVYTIVLITMLLLGATIVLTLELVITTLQAIRLHWVEFFSKMHYSGSGRKYRPFTAARKNTSPLPIESVPA